MTNAFGVSNRVPIKSIIGMTHSDYSSLLLLKNNIYCIVSIPIRKIYPPQIGYSILKVEDWIFCQLLYLMISNEVA